MGINKDSQKAPNLRFKGFTDDWEQRKLGELSEISRGASPRPIQDPKWFDKDSDIGWLRIADVTEQNGRITQLEQKISNLAEEKTRVLLTPHLLLSIAATVGKPVINYVKTGVHDGFLIFYKPQFDQEFMFQWLEMFRPKWQKYGQPGSQVNLNSELVKNQEILLPSLDEQIKISTFFKTLDDTIALHQRKLDQLKQLKEALLQQMFPGKGETVPKLRFAGFEGDWEERKFDEFLEEFIRKSKIENEFTTLSSTNSGMEVREGRVSGDTNIGYKIIENDDLVLSPQNLWLGNINLNYIGTGLVSPSYKTFKIKNLSSSFLKPQLRSKRLLNQYELASTQGASVVRRNLDMELFYQITLPVPVIQEQYKIGKLFKDLDDYIVLQSQKVNKLKSMKEVLLQNMFI